MKDAAEYLAHMKALIVKHEAILHWLIVCERRHKGIWDCFDFA